MRYVTISLLPPFMGYVCAMSHMYRHCISNKSHKLMVRSSHKANPIPLDRVSEAVPSGTSTTTMERHVAICCALYHAGQGGSRTYEHTGPDKRGNVRATRIGAWPVLRLAVPAGHNVTMIFPQNTGATPTLLARRLGMGRGSSFDAERHGKDASGTRRIGHRQRRALGRLGRLGGVSHQDVPNWPFGGDCDRQSFANLTPHGNAKALAVAASEDIGPGDLYGITGLVAKVGHSAALLIG